MRIAHCTLPNSCHVSKVFIGITWNKVGHMSSMTRYNAFCLLHWQWSIRPDECLEYSCFGEKIYMYILAVSTGSPMSIFENLFLWKVDPWHRPIYSSKLGKVVHCADDISTQEIRNIMTIVVWTLPLNHNINKGITGNWQQIELTRATLEATLSTAFWHHLIHHTP